MRSTHTFYRKMATFEALSPYASQEELNRLVLLISNLPAAQKIFLFGSTAHVPAGASPGRGDVHDVDLLIVASCTQVEAFSFVTELFNRSPAEATMRPVDFIVWTEDQWLNAKETRLGREVLREGKVLWERSLGRACIPSMHRSP